MCWLDLPVRDHHLRSHLGKIMNQVVSVTPMPQQNSMLRKVRILLIVGYLSTLSAFVLRYSIKESDSYKMIVVQTAGKASAKDEVEEAISEEEAVCRICMDSLTEDHGEILKMECRCRGEMALAHKECAFKWFGIKGDRVCDVCGSVVQNIPVTVVRYSGHEQTVSHSRSIDAQTVNRYALHLLSIPLNNHTVI